MVPNDLSRLIKRLPYPFKDPALLKRALTHRSSGSVNNERFEFLGDSILNFVIAEALFMRFPNESEGQLSRLRASLVKGEMLAEIARELQLGDFLSLGLGELKSGGFRRTSILADALEALIAAVFFDGGIEASRQFIMNLYESRLNDKNMIQHNLKDAKTLLQEFLQARKYALPEYHLVKIDGNEHEQTFHISCEVSNFKQTTQGIGTSRRKAEQQAACLLLQLLVDSA